MFNFLILICSFIMTCNVMKAYEGPPEEKILYLRTSDNKKCALPITKAQESIPLRMFIEQFGANTKKTPLMVGYIRKEIKAFSDALDKPIDEDTVALAERFKALNLYGKCIAQYIPCDVGHIIVSNYLPVNMLTHQIIKYGHTKITLQEGHKPPRCFAKDIHFGPDNYFTTILVTGTLEDIRLRQCQLWDMNNNTIVKCFDGYELESKFSPCGNYLLIKFGEKKLIFYDIKRKVEALLCSDIGDLGHIDKIIISPYGRFIVVTPLFFGDPITIWQVDEYNTVKKLSLNFDMYDDTRIVRIEDILFHSNEFHMFALSNNIASNKQILLYNLETPHVAPIIIECSLMSSNNFEALVFNDDESCIALRRNPLLDISYYTDIDEWMKFNVDNFIDLFDISKFSNIIDISHILQDKEKHEDVYQKYIASFVRKLVGDNNRKFIFKEKCIDEQTKGFVLRDYEGNDILSCGMGSERSECAGKLSPSLRDLIVIKARGQVLGRENYKPSASYSITRFTLMTQEKENIITMILKKLTTAQAVFLYSLCKTLQTKKEYCIYSDSLEYEALNSFDEEAYDLLTQTLPIQSYK